MSVALWVLIGLVVFVICGYGFVRKRLQLAKQQEARADWSKVREWDDDDDDWGKKPPDDGAR
ncbi:hypothetical protein [Abyssibacter sp.]|jgi:hypothetical protein|uniref:hypothetical protein n=1 Tax=Abyssibacter sp. TaxID=2320200 RepID=UPI0025BFA56F|nr:hypothetical protein [Abyssibacter sp.]MCK5860610.1 hypothetical protein [Abyssibacter sp.]